MSFISAVWQSFCRALIRYFDSLFVKSNDVEYYRMEIAKLQSDYQELLKSIIQPKVNEPVTEDVEWKPVNVNENWNSKRKRLERESLEKARALVTEAKMNIARAKTTEELENELLTGTE